MVGAGALVIELRQGAGTTRRTTSLLAEVPDAQMQAASDTSDASEYPNAEYRKGRRATWREGCS